MPEVQVFGEVDMRNNKVSSYLPAWYHDVHIENMKETCDDLERRIELNQIPQENLHDAKVRLKQDRERLSQIISSRPKLDGAVKDKVGQFHKEIGDSIAESLFTRTQMKKGIADAHEEARRMIDPCIPVRGFAKDFAKDCGVKVTNGKVSRNGASKMWKIAGKMLGDQPTNVEVLRRD